MNCNTEKKLIIFDGTSIMNDFYHKSLTKEFQEWKKGNLSEELAYKSLLKSSNEKYINAVQGFLKLLFELIDVQNPSHLVVVWGSFREKNFRNEICSGYKGSSTDLDYPLKEQFSTIKALLSKMNIIQYSSHKYESQDLAGSIAKFFNNQIPTYIFTRNSNLLQLTEFSKVWIKTKNASELAGKFHLDLSTYPKDYILYNRDLVKKIVGLEYYQVTDYKAVLGNKNSGIPGAKGVGRESIIPLLNHFNSIDELYEKIDMLSQDEIDDLAKELKEKLSLKKNCLKPLLDNKQNVLLSKELITIKTDIITSLNPDRNPLTLSGIEVHINKRNIISELRNLDLTPFVKDMDNMHNNTILSSLIQTYNPYILSPSAKEYIGENISNISGDSIRNINSIIYLPNVNNIVKIREKNISNKDVEPLKSIDDISDSFMKSPIEESIKESYISLDELLENNGINKESDSNLKSILNTLPSDSILKNLLDFDSKNTKNSSISLDDNNSSPFELMESFTVYKYQCSHCKKEFTVINESPKFCTNCGYGKDEVYKSVALNA